MRILDPNNDEEIMSWEDYIKNDPKSTEFHRVAYLLQQPKDHQAEKQDEIGSDNDQEVANGAELEGANDDFVDSDGEEGVLIMFTPPASDQTKAPLKRPRETGSRIAGLKVARKRLFSKQK